MNPHTSSADRNCRRFLLFRVLFNARFYYPVLAILFLDLGLSAAQYTVLNFAWAIAIVCAEVPFGVLADRIGRRPVVIAAGACMVLEMLVLCLAPRNGGSLLFGVCLVNRVLSGIAEALASGADESLAYDALAAEGRAGEWPAVLARVMRWQSFALVCAMLIGSAVYDPALLNRVGAALGLALHLDAATTLRFPVYLNLLAALVVLWTTLGLRETVVDAAHAVPRARQALHSVLEAGRWILHTPLALFVIVAGLLIDSVVRVFLTIGSAYYRLIDLPEASYGLIGAAMAGIGLLVAPLAKRLVETVSVRRCFALLGATAFAGLVGIALGIPRWGVLFVVPVASAIGAVGFALSHYLNAAVDARHRATVLSFKGLAFNLAYGSASLLFAGALQAMRGADRAGDGLGAALGLLPLWLAATGVLVWAWWRKRSV